MFGAAAAFLLTAIALLSPAVAEGNPVVDWSAPATVETDDSLPFDEGRAIDCASDSFCVAVGSAGGVLVSDDPASGFDAWDSFVIGPPAGEGGAAPELIDVSCPEEDFCAAVSEQGSFFFSSDPGAGPGAWTETEIESQGELSGVSCASPGFCAAVNDHGQVLISQDPEGGAGAWSATQVPGALRLMAISCPSASFCAAVDRGVHDEGPSVESEIFISVSPAGGAGAWVGAGTVENAQSIDDISCPSASFCVAPRFNDILVSTDPTAGASAWGVTELENYASLDRVSCPSAGFCAITAGWGDLWTSVDPLGGSEAWSKTEISSVNFWHSRDLSCPTVDLCAIIRVEGDVVTSTDPTGGAETWSIAHTGGTDGYLSAISCPEATFCAAVDSNGSVYVSSEPFSPSSWHGFSITPRQPLDVSCADPTLCVVVAVGGEVLVSTEPAAGAQAWDSSELPYPAFGVSCPQVDFCAAANATAGRVLTTTEPAAGGGSWNALDLQLPDERLGPRGVWAADCPSAAFCGVGGSDGLTFTSSKPTGALEDWTKAWLGQPIEPGSQHPTYPDISDMSCPAPHTCVSIDGTYIASSADTEAGLASWTEVPLVTGHRAQAISCPIVSFCVNIDWAGTVVGSMRPLTSSSSWGRAEVLRAGGEFNDLDCSPDLGLCAAVNAGAEVFVGIPDPSGEWEAEPNPFRPTGGEPATEPPSAAAPSAPACRVKKPRKSRKRRAAIHGARALTPKRHRAVRCHANSQQRR